MTIPRIVTRSTFWKNLSGHTSRKMFLLVILQVCLTPCSEAGPPLAIDDPGILDPGRWEVIVALTGHDRSTGKVMQAPSIDISRGISRNTQISFSLPRVSIKPDTGESKTGLAYASLGYKWRFFSSPTWELAIAPNFTLPVSHEIIRPNGPEDINLLGLPLLISHSAGDWTWLGQAGWNTGSEGVRFWDYGLAVSHPLGKSAEWMIEVHGNANSSFEQRTLDYLLGLDFEINPDLHLLTSAGSRIRSETELDSQLNFSFYLGLQWFH